MARVMGVIAVLGLLWGALVACAPAGGSASGSAPAGGLAGSGAGAASSPAGSATGAAGGPAGSGAGAGGAAGGSAAGPAPAVGRSAYPTPNDPETRLRGAWCAPTGAQFPLWLAKEAGIFARHRLDVDVQFIQGADANLAALLRGEVDFLDCSGSAVIPGLMVSGEHLMVANFYQGLPYRLVVHPDLERVSDLRGRKLAISRPGEYDNRLAEVMLERHGLVPNQDVLLVPVGTQTDRLNALRAGIVDGTTVNPPTNLIARNEGFREIYNLNEMGVSGVSVAITVSKRFAQSEPRVVERILAALTEATIYAQADREATIQTMSDYLKLTDRRALDGTYDTYVLEQMAIPALIPLDGVQAVMDETLRFNPAPPVRDAAAIVDNGPLQRVVASGFVDAVRAEYPASRPPR